MALGKLAHNARKVDAGNGQGQPYAPIGQPQPFAPSGQALSYNGQPLVYYTIHIWLFHGGACMYICMYACIYLCMHDGSNGKFYQVAMVYFSV